MRDIEADVALIYSAIKKGVSSYTQYHKDYDTFSVYLDDHNGNTLDIAGYDMVEIIEDITKQLERWGYINE